MPKTVRVLSSLALDDQKYPPNSLVTIDDKRAKSLEASGDVDSDADAVSYCREQLGVEVIDHAEVVAALKKAQEPGAKVDEPKQPE
ncbi:hypothetical protein ACKZDW_09005 [Ralstonia syzygii subsp. celebesensis]|uniref:Uncharacterized protein n=3 Tax=Ralstonia syzygii TaxID=28097 RepID=A0A1U9VET2_9RALS|nr:hypothetical protein [Ralstonia syzygii]AQW28813.1 hypothetical protein B0B51_01460 [blood disease bacterium A2-HR MARDI]QQV54638.1 hypothetical protein JK151_10680 [Ralstonia syzygii subsp. celebesensis]CCA79059.1 hypothetical protein BDB_40010 [blood disease bacterium R229]